MRQFILLYIIISMYQVSINYYIIIYIYIYIYTYTFYVEVIWQRVFEEPDRLFRFTLGSTALERKARSGKSSWLVNHHKPSLNHNYAMTIYTGWWFQPLWKIWQSMGRIIPYKKWKIKNVPNHQPVYVYIISIIVINYITINDDK